MKFFRHLQLYLWKNSLQKGRNCGNSCCETATPILLVALFAWLYLEVKIDSYPPTTYECDFNCAAGVKYGFEYLPRALNMTATRLGLVGDDGRFKSYLNAYYPGLTSTVMTDLNCTAFNVEVGVNGGPDSFPPFDSNALLDFNSEADLESYIADDAYGMDELHPPLYAAIVFMPASASGVVYYKLRMNASDIPDTHTTSNALQRGVLETNMDDYWYATPFSGDSAHPLGLNMPGFIPIQLAVDRFIVNSTSTGAPTLADVALFAASWGCFNPVTVGAHAGDITAFLSSASLAPQRVNMAPFPTSAYTQNDFYTFVSQVFALVFVLSFFFPSFFLIRGIVLEKETKIREGMRMMGMGDLALYTAWYITYGTVFLVIAFFITLTTSLTFFSNSDGSLIFLYFWLFGLSATALCFALSTFFSQSKLASAVGAVLFIATFFPYFQVNGATEAYASKMGASILSPVAFGLALDILATLESNGVGLHWSTMHTTYNNFTFADALGMMFFDCIFYTLCGWYLGAVLPQDFGLPLPWYFPFTSKYWVSLIWGEGGGASSSSGREGGIGKDDEPLLDNMDTIGVASGENIEAPGNNARELMRTGRSIAIRGLTKEFNTPDGVKRAVDNLSLDMFEGQIFALLGHNGAGKTTTISMLSGLIPPSSGDAYVYGSRISTDMSRIRTSMGVCPQHDVLWPDITVREHLTYFAGIKGVPTGDIDRIVLEMIREVGLTEKINVYSRELSGGQKRKLSVGIALIGGSKIVFLDEPTSGMDPYSRRFTWNLLQNNRAGRVIILTTHFMDEADILGDRIGIMANGDIRCCGSSMFLKKRHGVGYNLTIVKAPGCNASALETLVRSHISEMRVLSNVGSEMSFQVPLTASTSFPALFTKLERDATTLHVATYGVSVTTLEEVFIRVAEEGPGGSHTDHEAAKEEKAKLAAAKEARMSARASMRASKKGMSLKDAAMETGVSGSINTGAAEFSHGEVDEYTRAETDKGRSVFVRHFIALFVKRLRNALRDRRAIFFQLFIPVAALLVGLLLLRQVTTNTFPAIRLGMNGYNPGLSNFIPITNTSGGAALATYMASAGNVPGGMNNYAGAVNNASFVAVTSAALAAWNTSAYEPVSSSCNATNYADSGVPIPYRELLMEPDYSAASVWAFSNWLLATRNGSGDPAGVDEQGASRYGAYIVTSLVTDPAPPQEGAPPPPGASAYVSYTALINTTALHNAPSFINMLHSGLYNYLTGGVNASIVVDDAPLPFTKRQVTVVNSLTSFVAVLFIVIAFSFIPASFAVFIVKEREVNAKHLQLISGVSIPAYWCSTYAWDIINYMVPCIAAIILVVAFNVTELVSGDSLKATVALFFFYGSSVASFTYVLTYLFSSHSTAQIMTLIINLLCVILLLASFVMQQIDATCPADTALKYIYRFIPGYALGNGLLQLSLLKELPYLENDCGRMPFIDRVQQKFAPFDLPVTGYSILYMALESVGYFLLAMLIDVMLSYPRIRSTLLPDKDFVDKPYTEDDDVVAETARVDAHEADDDVIRIQHLRKVYAGGKVAVRNLSFGIPKGEVFGFLGINGAGKTTTLKMLSGDVVPTSGTAHLAGYDILSEQIEVRRLLGYTPQFDALLELLTTREHLELYARIKGVPEAELARVVDAKIAEMDLLQYSNKLAGSLSGGNKRKLSVAIAMIGDPPLIFLDEPSTGMDPVARRFMWNVISRIATERQQCSIILTTHSMEECEALCTRVGIMVGGRLRCLGPIQHIKNKYGKGFLIVVKLATPPPERVDAVMQHSAQYFVNDRLPTGSLHDLCEHLGDATRARMVHASGSGWALAATLAKEGSAPATDFADWWAFESLGAHLHAFMRTQFPGARLVERHGEFFRYQIDDTGRPLSAIFGVIEAEKARLHVAEYSCSQISLETIFNLFAAQQEEETGAVRGMDGPAGTDVGKETPTSASAVPARSTTPGGTALRSSPVPVGGPHTPPRAGSVFNTLQRALMAPMPTSSPGMEMPYSGNGKLASAAMDDDDAFVYGSMSDGAPLMAKASAGASGGRPAHSIN